jgi:hypothetical protein
MISCDCMFVRCVAMCGGYVFLWNMVMFCVVEVDVWDMMVCRMCGGYGGVVFFLILYFWMWWWNMLLRMLGIWRYYFLRMCVGFDGRICGFFLCRM